MKVRVPVRWWSRVLWHLSVRGWGYMTKWWWWWHEWLTKWWGKSKHRRWVLVVVLRGKGWGSTGSTTPCNILVFSSSRRLILVIWWFALVTLLVCIFHFGQFLWLGGTFLEVIRRWCKLGQSFVFQLLLSLANWINN